MSKENSGSLSVAEGLLPLLDVSIMLLGLFLVLLAAGKFQEASASDSSSIAGIGQVIVLRITPRGTMHLQSGLEDEAEGRPVTLMDLRPTLEQTRLRRGEKRTLVLIYYEDVWTSQSPDFARLKKLIWDSGCAWARVY